jgi:DNA-binding GntR family transcriptional regulator
MKTESTEQRSMRELAYQHIQRRIATRVLKAGAPVSEQAMAKEAGVSRTPMREAIRQLVAEGVLQEVPGRGVVVVKLEQRDIEEIYEIREALEVRAAITLAEREVDAAGLDNLRKITAEIESLAEKLEHSGRERLDSQQMTRCQAADIAFHTYFLQMAGNRRSMAIVTGLRALVRTVAMPRIGYPPEQLLRIHQGHRELLDAIADRDPARAAAAISAHIQGSRQHRLELFTQRERESDLPRDIPAFLKQIQADLA